jgi:tetratricopeptide (TPR) repeat protein
MAASFVGSRWFLLCAFVALMASAPVCLSESEAVDTVFKQPADWAGLGEKQAALEEEAAALVVKKLLPEAEEKLKAVTAACEGLMTDPNATYVCFHSAAQFDAFRKDVEKEKGEAAAIAVVRVSFVYGKALHLQAFIASARKQWPEALALLDREMQYSPYEALPYMEKGYILNAQRKHPEAIECYKKGLEVAAKREGTDQVRASAWRGIGFAQTELGDLDAAKTSYNESLKLEPNNKLALDELSYIENLERSKKAGQSEK